MNIFLDNFEKYEHPDLYDQQYSSYKKDFPLLLEWANKQGGRVADLACGTGRVTMPLAEEGFSITGVDLHEGMLRKAMEKSQGLSIEWVLQDCTKLDLPQAYSFMYMTGNSFQHFLTNESQNKLLQSVHRHLERDGVFIFGTRYPILNELAKKEETTHTYLDYQGRIIRETSVEEYNPLTQILLCTSVREIINEADQLLETENDRISLRYVYPMEMERILYQNGLIIENAYGSWDKKPLSNDSKEMIYVCRKATLKDV